MVDKSKMKSIQAKSAKLDFELALNEIPKPNDGEVLVRLVSATIHPSDLLKGVGFFGPITYPALMGLEGYGEVVEDKSNSNLKGKYVGFWSVKASSWAEYSVVPVVDLIVAPKYEKKEAILASNFFLNPVTALGLLETTINSKAKAVAFNAANSQVSSMLIKLFQEKGIKTIGIVRKDDQIKPLQSRGATAVFNSTSKDFLSNFGKEAEALGVSVFIDSVGGEDAATSIRVLPNNSLILSYGALSGSVISDEVKKELAEKKGFTFKFQMFSTDYYYKLNNDQKTEISGRIAKELNTTFSTQINKTVKIEDVPSAYNEYFKDMSKGKIVIEY